MKQTIRIADGLEWTPGEPNAEAREWINARMGEVTPEKDRYGRPAKWTMTTSTATVTVTRAYIRPGAWAKDRDIIEVKPKTETA